MDQISIIGLDLAKGVFHAVGRDGSGARVLSRSLRRGQVLAFFARLEPCVVAMEACASAHFWAREIEALGHEARLIPPIYVKPYVVRNKNDFRAADGRSLAAARPDMRTVSIKIPEQQARASLHRVRDLLIRQRTQAANQIRGLTAEFGLHARQGRDGLKALIAQAEAGDLPHAACLALAAQGRHHRALDAQIDALTDEITAQVRACEAAGRLMTIPGIGEIAADALPARLPDPAIFKSGRDLVAWLGLTRLDRSTGGKAKTHGPISKRGDRSLGRLLVLGATSVIARQRRAKRLDPWIAGLLQRRCFRIAATALAAKDARIVWALLVRGGAYQPGHQPRLAA